MIYGTHLNSIYSEHAKELHKRYRRVSSRSTVAESNYDQSRRAATPNFSSSHTTVATVRLAAGNFIDILV